MHLLILPKDIRRKAIEPSKKRRRTPAKTPASPNAWQDSGRAARRLLPCWRSRPGLAAAREAAEAAARAACRYSARAKSRAATSAKPRKEKPATAVRGQSGAIR